MNEIEGMDGLQEKLENYVDDLLPRIAKAMGVELKLIQAEAKMNTPVAEGEARNSIITETAIEGESVIGVVKATAPHSVFIEMGTGPMGEANHAGVAPVPVTYRSTPWVYYSKKHKSFFTTKGMPARPFLYPAFAKRKKNLARNIARRVRNEGL